MVEGILRGAVAYVHDSLGGDLRLGRSLSAGHHNRHRIGNAEHRPSGLFAVDFLQGLFDKWAFSQVGKIRRSAGPVADCSSDRKVDPETSPKSDPLRTRESR